MSKNTWKTQTEEDSETEVPKPVIQILFIKNEKNKKNPNPEHNTKLKRLRTMLRIHSEGDVQSCQEPISTPKSVITKQGNIWKTIQISQRTVAT